MMTPDKVPYYDFYDITDKHLQNWFDNIKYSECPDDILFCRAILKEMKARGIQEPTSKEAKFLREVILKNG